MRTVNSVQSYPRGWITLWQNLVALTPLRTPLVVMHTNVITTAAILSRFILQQLNPAMMTNSWVPREPGSMQVQPCAIDKELFLQSWLHISMSKQLFQAALLWQWSIDLHSDKMDGQEPFKPLAYYTKYSMTSSRAICRQQRTLRLSWKESWKKFKELTSPDSTIMTATRCRLNEWTGHSDVRLLLSWAVHIWCR